MIRILILLAAIALLSIGLGWAADQQGFAVIEWGTYRIEMAPLTLVAFIALLSFAFLFMYLLVFFTLRLPGNWLRSRQMRRQSQGLAALTQAFAAIATQDVGTARRKLARAQYFLPDQPLTLMLSSQVARLEGNEGQARLYFERMLGKEDTEFVALRGLIEAARRDGNPTLAIQHAEKALSLRANDPWLIATTAGLYTMQGRAQHALDLLERSYRRRAITRAQEHRLSAMALYENARALIRHQRVQPAEAALRDALKKQPDFIPAASCLAGLYLKRHKIRQSLGIIASAWKVAPHTELRALLLECYDADDDRKKVVATAEKLARSRPDHPESGLLLAALALRSGDPGAARRHAEYTIQHHETAYACQLMAAIETQGGQHETASAWLKRSQSAPADAAWHCSACGQIETVWEFICPHCSAVGTATWR